MIIIKKIFVIIAIFALSGCADYKISKKKIESEKKYYSSSGFALIYDYDLYKNGLINKKYTGNDIMVMHSTLKKNTPVAILNPINSKRVVSKIYKRAEYPNIFKIVISKKLAEILELDLDNPYIEIIEIKKNVTFIAKKAETFDEEKNVAAKAPVDKIEINILSENIDDNQDVKKKYSFILVISDFYYLNSANNLKNELNKKIKLDNLGIKKINNKKYRLYSGPFKNFNTLKSTYISLNKLGFEDLEILKNSYE